MSKPINESLVLEKATTVPSTETGLLEVEFLTPGWGSSGTTPRGRRGRCPLFAVGTHMYFDHPTDTEEHDRPGRSVRDLAAVIVEAGTVNKATGGSAARSSRSPRTATWSPTRRSRERRPLDPRIRHRHRRR
jgi:hypothetical protein